jgi:hypothetical protein
MAKTSIYLPDDLAEQVRAHAQTAADRLSGSSAVSHEAEGAMDLNMSRRGADWARQDASAEELEYLATYDGDPGEFQTPASLIDFERQVATSDQPLGGATPDGSPEDQHVPVRPGDPHWPSFHAGAREIWESAQPS